MRSHPIVICFDGTPASEHALREAAGLLAPGPAVVVFVWEAGRAFDLNLHRTTGVYVCAVILMSGRGSMETVMQATEGGAFEYLAKPFEMAQMIDTIKRAEKRPG